MDGEIKKIAIRDLPQLEELGSGNILLVSDSTETYKVKIDEITEYIVKNSDLESYYVPFNENKKVAGKYIIYGNTSNTAYEGSAGKTLETNINNHLLDEDAHGYQYQINEINGKISNIATGDKHSSTEPSGQTDKAYWIKEY